MIYLAATRKVSRLLQDIQWKEEIDWTTRQWEKSTNNINLARLLTSAKLSNAIEITAFHEIVVNYLHEASPDDYSSETEISMHIRLAKCLQSTKECLSVQQNNLEKYLVKQAFKPLAMHAESSNIFQLILSTWTWQSFKCGCRVLLTSLNKNKCCYQPFNSIILVTNVVDKWKLPNNFPRH